MMAYLDYFLKFIESNPALAIGFNIVLALLNKSNFC